MYATIVPPHRIDARVYPLTPLAHYRLLDMDLVVMPLIFPFPYYLLRTPLRLSSLHSFLFLSNLINIGLDSLSSP